MPGGTLQLHCYGTKNIYFNGNPQLTFFKTIYKRHTNFAIEHIPIISTTNMSLGNKTEFKLDSSQGNLISNIYIHCNIDFTFSSSLSGNIINLGHNLINKFNIEIGGKIIDEQYGYWLQVWEELSDRNTGGSNGNLASGDTNSVGNLYTNNQKTKGLGLQKINSTNLNTINSAGSNNFYYSSSNSQIKGDLYLNLPFWFTKNLGVSLPLIAIKDEIKIFIELNSLSDSIVNLDVFNKTGIVIDSGTTNMNINNLGILNTDDNITLTDNSTFKLIGEFVFLEKFEQRALTLKNHEYLIEQVQYLDEVLDIDNNSVVNKQINIPFQYCIKELIWCFQRKTPLFHSELLSLADHNGKCKIIMNGENRFTEQNVLYFTRYQPNKYHTGRGGINSPDSIFVYSFCLYPEKYQPSGICNFSVLEKIELLLEDINLATDYNRDYTKGVDLKVFGVNYNIMEIRDGQVDVLFKPTL